MQIDPVKTYIALAPDGQSTVLPGGDAFWSLPMAEIDQYGKHWLISEYAFDADWPSWEMHPHADEFVYMLSGAADFVLKVDGAEQHIALKAGKAVLIPRGHWHTAKMTTPGRMLFFTRGEGTEHMSVS
ncbi:cupin domain-containing protein [Undibacterium sp. CY18W]|uniref:Cupin domain-containing protein n=1 Tax=Undibacterium hunanense TaxID=2762292 RepID=A0ABR6ZWT3_9BURK|nr:cupin domain-containing protein [Undibacterium hunanense]MBC3920093.1 cupin domain-containing protein [Undibacterium hunanense]